MFALNVFSALVFFAINLGAIFLLKREKAARIVIKLLCVVLLVFQSVKLLVSYFIGNGLNLPVEFSSVAYFTVSSITLFNIRRLKCWATYSGLMAGFFYYLAMIFCGGSIYAEYPAYEIYLSMFCHGTLYLCGLWGIKGETFRERNGYRLLWSVALVVLNAHLLRPLIDSSQRLFIYELLDGSFVKLLFPAELWGSLLTIYYVVMVSLVILSVRLFFALNAFCVRKKEDKEKKNKLLENNVKSKEFYGKI